MGELASCQILFQRKLKGAFYMISSKNSTYFHYRHTFFFFFSNFPPKNSNSGKIFFLKKKKGFTILMNSFFPVMKTQENLYWSFWKDWGLGNCHTEWTQWQPEKNWSLLCSKEGSRVGMWVPPRWERVLSLPGPCYCHSRNLGSHGGAQVRKPLSPKHHSHHLWAHWSSRVSKLGRKGCVGDHTQAHIVFLEV